MVAIPPRLIGIHDNEFFSIRSQIKHTTMVNRSTIGYIQSIDSTMEKMKVYLTGLVFSPGGDTDVGWQTDIYLIFLWKPLISVKLIWQVE